MTKKENTSTEVNKVPFYKKAATPWIIILVLATLLTGFIGGFHYHQSLEQEITARSAQLAEKSKENQ